MEKIKFFNLNSLVAVLLLSFLSQCVETVQPKSINNTQQQPPVEDTLTTSFLGGFKITNSLNYKNLQLFLIEGDTNADSINYVTLKVAMENNWVEIRETSNVSELKITNKTDKTIFINAGEIVRGGKQDRTIVYDLIIPPKAKNEKLSSFCVESGRWEKRGAESEGYFKSSANILTSRKLKLASKKHNNQSYVWAEVAEEQDKLSMNLSDACDSDINVKSSVSGSSFELTLENKDLTKMKDEYKEYFSTLSIKNSIGLAYAINGKLYNLDIYNNRKLFSDLSDKLIDAAIIESISNLDKMADKMNYLKIEELDEIINNDGNLKEEVKILNKRTKWVSQENESKVVFTSLDLENNSIWVHKNIIIKDSSLVQNAVISNMNFQNFENENIQLQED